MKKKTTLFSLFFLILNIYVLAQSIHKRDQLSDGVKILFGNIVTKLTTADKNSIYHQITMLKINPDNTFSFTDGNRNKTDVVITPVDLNDDGLEEIFILFDDMLFDHRVQLFVKNQLSNQFANVLVPYANKYPLYAHRNKKSMADLVFLNSSEEIGFILKWNILKQAYETSGAKPDYLLKDCTLLTKLNNQYHSQLEKNRTAQEANLDKCIEIIFKKVVTQLTSSEKASFAENLIANRDNTLSFPLHDFKLNIAVTPVDLNNDGLEEDFVIYKGNDNVAFRQELGTIKKYGGTEGILPQLPLNFSRNLPYLFYTNLSAFPDLVFVDSSGKQISCKWSNEFLTYEKDTTAKKYILSNGKSVHKANQEYTSKLLKDIPKLNQTYVNNDAKINRYESKLSNKKFGIDPQWVTHPNDKYFKWYDWSEAPDNLKIAAGYLNIAINTHTKKMETVLDEINNSLENNCLVKVAAIDLDNNGIAGLATYSEGQYCCGQSGACAFRLIENAGARIGSYIERTGKPSPAEYKAYIMKSGDEIIINKPDKDIISLFKYNASDLNLKPITK